MSIARVGNGVLVRSLIAVVVLLGGVGSASGEHDVDNATVIENVTLISPERSAPLPHAHVVIRDGKIAEISTSLVPGQHVRRIDGSRRFLIPGLIDSHVHVGHSAALDDDANKPSTTNAEAYQLYLKGRYHANQATAAGLKKGIEYFQQAIERDPGGGTCAR